MAAWRNLGVVAWLLTLAATAPAQTTYPLAEPLKADECFHVRIDMNLTGEIRVLKADKVLPVKRTATATHEFNERVLNVTEAGFAARTARSYETAKAAIATVGAERVEMTLRPERRLLISQRDKDEALTYCPAGPLTREELDVTEHFDTLHVNGILPGKDVAVGATWKVTNPVTQALCAFEGLSEQDLVCKLESVEQDVATISVKGTATGIDVGSQVRLTIDAKARFDLKTKRLTTVEWKQKDEREQGPASPQSVIEVTTTLKRSLIETPEALTDGRLASVPTGFDVPGPMLNLYFRDPRNRFDLMYARDWQLVAATPDQVVLRLMERGEFVAQATVIPWTKAEAGKHATPDQLRQAVSVTPGWQPERELQASEIKEGLEEGYWLYRISTVGKLDGMDVMQNFYLMAGPDGRQVILTFTMTPKQVERLGSRDLSLAGSVDFPK